MDRTSVIAQNDALAGALETVVERVQRSLATVQDGRRGVGAGIIWGRAGLILTNNHVVAHNQARVRLWDQRDFEAQVVARDPEVDLALLQIAARDLPAALVADSDGVRVGQLVLAVGHPWGQRGMVTVGMVSGLSEVQTRSGRSLPVIRSDVELAPGNSGGPLVNAAGAVVGINTMIVGGDLSLAVPSRTAAAFVSQVLEARTPGRGEAPFSVPRASVPAARRGRSGAEGGPAGGEEFL